MISHQLPKILGLCVIFLLSAVVHTGSASAGSAWLWVDGNNPPNASYSFNSSGGVNSFKALTQPGSYLISLPGLPEPDVGTVQVTAYGGAGHCKPVRWVKRPDAKREIAVACFDARGRPAASSFTLFYFNRSAVPKDSAGYVHADRPGEDTYVPAASFQWNANGKTNTVERKGAGHYVVRYPGAAEVAEAGGIFLVTAVGGGAEHCQAGDWIARGEAVEATVYCFDSNGILADTQFSALYSKQPGFGAVTMGPVALPYQGAFLWGHGHTFTRPYVPNRKYQFGTAQNTVSRSDVGQYEAALAGVKAMGKSIALVSVYGPAPALCSVSNWQPWTPTTGSGPRTGSKVKIACVDPQGRPADAQFTLLYLTDDASLVARTVSHKISYLRDTGRYYLQKVFYGTDRADAGVRVPVKDRYTYARDASDSFSYGVASVSIPHDHRMGGMEGPGLLSWGENPEHHVVLLSLDELEKNVFLRTIRDAVASSGGEGKQALIFVHGYNVTFEDAARRTAQMAYDLEFKGPALFYSWPSRTTEAGYPADEESVQWAMPHIRDFIKDVVRQTGVDTVHLIAHSMGTRGLTAALREQRDGLSESDFAKIRTIMLAAPDIDAEIFARDIVPEIKDRAHVTVYASDNDQALNLSYIAHLSGRTGITDHLRAVQPAGIEFIDASGVEAGFTGHSYYGDNDSIITDMRKVLTGATQPQQRCHLLKMETARGVYWYFNEGPCVDRGE